MKKFAFLMLGIGMALFGTACSLGGDGDDSPSTPTTQTVSGTISFPATAGTSASIHAGVSDFTKFKCFVNGLEATLSSGGAFSVAAPIASKYTITVTPLAGGNTLLSAITTNALGLANIAVNSESTAKALLFSEFIKNSANSTATFDSFATLLAKVPTTTLQQVTSAYEKLLQSAATLQSTTFNALTDSTLISTLSTAGSAVLTAATSTTTSTSSSSTTSSTTTTSSTSTTTSTAAKPSGLLKINEDKTHTYSTTVTLNLSSVSGTGNIQMSIDGGAFQAFEAGKSYTLSGGDGTKTVKVVLKDDTGQSSADITDTIILDTTALGLTSTNFTAGGKIPNAHGGRLVSDGHPKNDTNTNPQFAWTNTPATMGSLILVFDDPDAPTTNPFVHWLVYDIPTTVTSLTTALASPTLNTKYGTSGLTDWGAGATIYRGPAPAAGNATHTYRIRLFAIDAKLGLAAGKTWSEIQTAISGKIQKQAELKGFFGLNQ